jgi:hypothetical protein
MVNGHDPEPSVAGVPDRVMPVPKPLKAIPEGIGPDSLSVKPPEPPPPTNVKLVYGWLSTPETTVDGEIEIAL